MKDKIIYSVVINKEELVLDPPIIVDASLDVTTIIKSCMKKNKKLKAFCKRLRPEVYGAN